MYYVCFQPAHNETAADNAGVAGANSQDVAAQTEPADIVDEVAGANAAVAENPGDNSDIQDGVETPGDRQANVDAASQCEETTGSRSLLMSSLQLNIATADTAVGLTTIAADATAMSEPAITAEPVNVTTVMDSACQQQNGLAGHYIQPTDGATDATSVADAKSMMDSNRAAGNDHHDMLDRPLPAAAATNADAKLVDVDGSHVQAPADALAPHNDGPAVAAAAAAMPPNEPQLPAADAAAADAEVANDEPVGNIIPAPLAVLAPQGLGDVHQAMMQGGGPVGFQPYKHPNLFALRVSVSIYLSCLFSFFTYIQNYLSETLLCWS